MEERADAPGGTPAASRAGLELCRLVASAAIGLVALVLFVDAGSLPASRWEPLGAGSFPRLVFALLMLLTALDAVAIARRLRAGRAPASRRALAALPGRWLVERRLVVGLFALLGLYLALIAPLGFPVATLAFMLAAGALLAPRTPRA